jgi:hypothetical protein
VGRKGRTILEHRWKDTDDFVKLAKEWNPDAIVILIGFVWQGYDLLVTEFLSQINCSGTEEQLERSITQSLERKIRRGMTGDEPFDIQHEVYELETSQSAQAQPPQYDIAFILRANERIILPLEAKVLKSDGAIAEYKAEINENFITCRYAPFSSEGGMLGYLLSGEPDKAFSNIAAKVPCKLSHHPNFLNRDHKTSYHKRVVPSEKPFMADFYCHHLLLKILTSNTTP